MRKNASSARLHAFLFISGLLLLQLSYNSVLFAATGSITHSSIIDNPSVVKIIHGPRILSTVEGEDIIDNANGTLVN